MTINPNNSLKKQIIQLGTRYGRLTISEIAEECHEDQEYIKFLLKEMIQNKEVSAKYFESTQSILFDQIPITSFGPEIKTKTAFESVNIGDKQSPKMEIGEVFEFNLKNYRIVKQIGKGGMGRILLAIEEDGSQQIVIKCLLFDRYRMNELGVSSCEEYWNREQEIIQTQSLSRYPSMHLVGALKGSDDSYYLFLEYIDGISLDKWFPFREAYPDFDEIKSLISTILIPLCNHLAYVHSQNILHRDITPKNIMISFRDSTITPILIDWGVAKEVNHSNFFNPPKPYFTQTRIQATGIHSVMNPPEILLGLDPIAASDIYMLGGIMFYLFTGGKIPSLPVTVEDYVLHPYVFNPILPVKLNNLVSQMTQYEPADRIQRVQEVILQLQEIMNESNIFHPLQFTSLPKSDRPTIIHEEVDIEERSHVDQHQLVDYHGTPIILEQFEYLIQIEKLVGSSIPVIHKVEYDTFGLKIENGIVIELGLYKKGLTSLPIDIGQLNSLQFLYVNSNELGSLPESIAQLVALKGLYASNNQLVSLPESIGRLISLRDLYIGNNLLDNVPESIKYLNSLQILYLNSNRISTLSDNITNLDTLEKLNLASNQLISLPDSIGHLTALKELDISKNRLTSLPENIKRLGLLEKLNISSNQLTFLPDGMDLLIALREFDVRYNQLVPLQLKTKRIIKLLSEQGCQTQIELDEEEQVDYLRLADYHGTLLVKEQYDVLLSLEYLVHSAIPNVTEFDNNDFGMKVSNARIKELRLNYKELSLLPKNIGGLTSLQILWVGNNNLTNLPDSIGQLTALKELRINNNILNSLPETIGQLTALQRLNLSKNHLISLPKSFNQLTQLQELNYSNNQLTSLPEIIGQLQSLQILSIGYNMISTLPEWFGKLIELKKLSADNNQLISLPECIGQLTRLEELNINQNQIKSLPENIDQLNQLKVLALSDNHLIVLPKTILKLNGLKELNVLGNKELSESGKSKDILDDLKNGGCEITGNTEDDDKMILRCICTCFSLFIFFLIIIMV